MGQPFKHTNYRTYRRYLEPYLVEKSNCDKFETICLVREPVSWLHSWYRFRSRIAAKHPDHPAYRNNTYGVNFDQFIEAYMSPNPPSFANVGSQFDFVRNEAGSIGVDSIFTYERIHEFFEYISEKVGSQLDIELRNVSPKANYRSGLALFIDRAKHKLRKKVRIPMQPVSVPPEALSPDVMNRLHTFIAADFQLYDTVTDMRCSAAASAARTR